MQLYHGKTSVCSAKVRVALEELKYQWTGKIVDLAKGEQSEDWYLAINPKGVVPALIDDETTVLESSVILEYLDENATCPSLMPEEKDMKVRAKIWLADCIDIHAAINTLTFATTKRRQMLANKTPEQIDVSLKRIANPFNAMKKRSILEAGLQSPFVEAAFFTLDLTFSRMQLALSARPWLLGEAYSLADTALIAYIDRLDRLGLSDMWKARYPLVTAWLAQSRSRASYTTAIEDFAGPAANDAQSDLAAENWIEVEPLWDIFVNRQK